MNTTDALKKPYFSPHLYLGLVALGLSFAFPLALMDGQGAYFSELVGAAPGLAKAILCLGPIMALLLVLQSLLSPEKGKLLVYLGGVTALSWLLLLLYYSNSIPIPPGQIGLNYGFDDRLWIASIHLLGVAAALRARYPESSITRWFAGLTALFIVAYFLMEAQDGGLNRTRIRSYAGLITEGGKQSLMGIYFVLHFVIALGAVLAFTFDALERWFRFVSVYFRCFLPVFFVLYFFVLISPGSHWKGEGTLWIILCAGLYFAACVELLVNTGLHWAQHSERIED